MASLINQRVSADDKKKERSCHPILHRALSLLSAWRVLQRGAVVTATKKRFEERMSDELLLLLSKREMKKKKKNSSQVFGARALIGHTDFERKMARS